MMKKLLFYISILFVILSTVTVNAKGKKVSCENDVNIYIFHGETCPHCQAAIEFFESIEEDYGSCFNLNKYEVWNSSENATLMTSVASYFGDEVSGVPYIVIGNKTFKGYAESYDEDIKSAIVEASNDADYVDVMTALSKNDVTEKDTSGSSIATVLIIVICVGGLVALIVTNKNNKND